MNDSATYSQLQEIYQECFLKNPNALDKDGFKTLLIGESSEMKRLSEFLNTSIEVLMEFRTDCIDFLADEYYNENLHDEYVELVIDSQIFKDHLSFLEELEAGVQSLEDASLLNQLQEIEDSIEAYELEAAITSIETERLLDQLKQKEAEILESETKVYASESKMFSVESPAAASRIASNRSMFIRIAAILVLVLIPTSIIIFLIPNSSTPPNEKSVQTAQKEEPDTDSDGKEDLLMGSSPNFLMDTLVPDIQSSRMKLPINNEDSFGFTQQIDSIEIQYQYYGSQNKYLESQIQVYKNEIARLDSIMLKSISGEEGLVGEGLFIKECEDRISKVRVMLDNLTSIYAQNIMKSNTYEYENNKIVIHFQCVKCAPFDPSKDVVEIKKEMEDIFLVINDDIEYLIEEGTHDLETE